MMDAETQGDLDSRLKAIAHHRGNVDVAQIQIIGLDEIRRAFGARWPAVRERVYQTSIGFLKRRVTPEDLIIACGNGFVVIFGSVEGTSAEIAGLQLARALTHFFLGEEGLSGLRIKCRHQSLEVTALPALIKALDAAPAAAPIEGTCIHDPTAQETTYRFQPIWDVKHAAVTTYAAVPYEADGTPVESEEIDLMSAAARHRNQLRDRAVITASVDAVRAILDHGDHAIIAMTLHASSLAETAHRRAVLESLGRIDPKLRRYLIVILGDVVHGFPRFHLDEIVRLLNQKIERVSVELFYDESDFDSIAESSAWGYGYRLPRLTLPIATDTAEAIKGRLQRDAKRAHRHNKRLLVGCHGPAETVRWAQSAGADFIASKTLWPVSTAPRGIERFVLPAIDSARTPPISGSPTAATS